MFTNKKLNYVKIINFISSYFFKPLMHWEKNKNTSTVLETVKTKIENNEAVTSEDFDDVFEKNVSPN